MKVIKKLVIQFAVVLIMICIQTVLGQGVSKTTIPEIDTISVLFPEVEYAEKDSKIEKSKTGYNVYISRNIADILKELIDGGNFLSKHVTILYEPSMSRQSLPEYYENAIIKFNQIRDSLELFRNKNRIFPINTALRKLLNKTNTRYFLYVTGLAFGTSEATKQYYMAQKQLFQQLYQNTLVHNYQWWGLQLQLVLLDAKSGRILWYNYNKENDSNYNPLNKDDIRRLCLELLQSG
jgi:hypothetical protein